MTGGNDDLVRDRSLDRELERVYEREIGPDRRLLRGAGDQSWK